MGIYVLQIGAANHWGRPTKIVFYGPFPNIGVPEPPAGSIAPCGFWPEWAQKPIAGSRDNKMAEITARRWMNHPFHAQQCGVLWSMVMELDEPPPDLKPPFVIW
jgi:hypothetical protein